jgi:hypothetical protein
MATTTNYSWTTPDDTALVKDGAAAIRTLGSSIDTTVKNLNPETTLGDLAYRSSTANVKTRLGLGTAGQVLQVNSGATAPEWVTPSSGGMDLLSTTTLSGSVTTVSGISTAYKNLQIVVRDALPATDGNYIYLRLNGDSGANRHGYSATFSGGGDTAIFNNTLVTIAADIDNAVADGLIVIDIFDYANTSTQKMGRFQGIMQQYDSSNKNLTGGYFYYNQTTAITSFELRLFSGNYSSGTVLVYGVK